MKTVVVLGMHRSATSLVARSLSVSGEAEMGGSNLDLDTMSTQPRGHYEDRGFVRLNDAILHAAGGDWRTPPPLEAILAQYGAFREKITELVRRREHEPVWGWKDPRTTLTADLYHPHLRDPVYLACLRGQGAVVESLVRRDGPTIGMTKVEAVALVREYTGRMLDFLRRVSA